MAEIPDLEYLRKVFTRELSRKRIVEAECLKPEVMNMIVDGDFATRLAGLKVTKIRRRGPFIILRTTGKERLVVNPMDEGHFKFPGLGTRRPRTLVFVLHMEGGPRVWFLDPGNSAKVYLTAKDQLHDVPGLMEQGADPLGKNFSPEKFRRICKKSQKLSLRKVLTNQEKISHIGPAYVDEILFDARLHPAVKIKKLGEDDLDRLYDSILDVLENACDIMEDRGQPIENIARDFLKVAGRAEQPCKRCGEPLQQLEVYKKDFATYCASCQAG